MNDRPRPSETADANAALQRASALHAAGDPMAAAAIYLDLATAYPDQAGLWALLGDALRSAGDPAAGADALDKATQLTPEDPDIATESALCLLETGDSPAALDRLERHKTALAHSERAQTVFAEANRNLRRFARAADHYRTVLAIAPNNNRARISLGVCLQETRDQNGAIAQYEQALLQDPDAVDALSNLGLALPARDSKRALALLERARDLDPGSPATLCNLGSILQRRGQTDKAIRCFEQATGIEPGDAKAWSNLGNALQDQLRLGDARNAHARAVELDPENADIRWNQAMTLLLSGNFAEGFATYEWRRKTSRHAPPKHSSPFWTGGNPRGKRLLLLAEQGFGDAIQFVRYAGVLQNRGAEIVIQCHPKLVALFATLNEAFTVIPTGTETPPVDAHVPLMSLPYLLGTTEDTIPAEVPYLRPPPGVFSSPEPTDGLQIGLCWTGNPDHPDNPHRSCPFDALRPLMRREGIAWRNLQYGPEATEAADVIPEDPAWTACLDGFANTAAALKTLDLVITVDTATAHLAGALGLRVWLLLKYAPDWRWMTQRDDSPWYPTMRLFRQESPGDWSGVVKRLESALDAGLDS